MYKRNSNYKLLIIRGTEILYYRGLRIQVTNYDFALESNFYDYVNAMAGYLENIKLRPLWNCPIVASFNPLKKVKVRIQISSYNTAPQFLGYTVLLDFSSKLRKLIINFVINNTNIFTDTCNMEKEHFIFIQISFYEKIKHVKYCERKVLTDKYFRPFPAPCLG